MNTLSHQEFVHDYKAGKLLVAINRDKASDFVLSEFADKHNKPAHYFWSYLGIFLVVPIPIVLFFFSWKYSIIAFVFGIFVISASRKSARQFVLQNMVDNEDFFEFVLLHKGARITDLQGKELKSEFLTRVQ